jgi:hypothetical protein
MERIRQAALTQDDEKLQCPFISNLADEVWKCKEAKLPTDDTMGDATKRGILMEAITATTLLNAGAELLVMRHPVAIQKVREYIAELGGFALPAAARAEATPLKRAAAGAPQVSGASQVVALLKEGALCRIVQCMDTPAELAPGYAMALIQVVDRSEAAGDELVLTTQAAAVKAVSAEGVAEAGKAAAGAGPKAPFKPAATWAPLEDVMGDYDYKLKEMKDFAGHKVKLIQESYAPGQAQGKEDWRNKSEDKEGLIKQVKTELHYWYGPSFGSERRKKPA